MARIELDEIMSGLGLLGNVLSIPQQIGNQQIQNEQTRLMLKDSGLPPEMIAAATPEPSMRWLSAHQPGFGGKVLGGVGDVGSILTTIVGKPIKAPRMELSDLAAASTLRTKHGQELAKKRLGAVILDPKSTNKDIAAAAIESGDTNEALRLLRRGGDSAKPPASILGLRGAIESMDPDDPRLPAYKRALDDQLEYNRQQDEAAQRRAQENANLHYLTPAQIEEQRHGQVMADRAKDAATLGLKEGTEEHTTFMATGRPPQKARERAARTIEDYIADENRRRNAMLKDPRQAKLIPNMESVETTARRNMAAAEKAGAAQKAGEELPPPPPPPKPKGLPGAAGGAAIGGILGGETPTPTSTPSSTTTSTTEPPADDAKAWEILNSIEIGKLSSDGQAEATQLLAAVKQGMPIWQAAGWAQSLR